MSKIEVTPLRACQSLARPASENSSLSQNRRLLFALIRLATIAMILVTDTAWAQLQEGDEVVTVTNAYWVRLRSIPEIRSDSILTRIAGGSQLKYLGTHEEWFQVELPGGTQGWLHSQYGRLDSARNMLKVAASVARIRKTPEQNSPVISRAIQGLMLEILEKEGPWYLVRLPLGEEGWVREDLVTLREVKPQRAESESNSANIPAPSKVEVAQVEAPIDESEGVKLLEITPLPISATASSGEEDPATSSPTLRSPKVLDKPRFLMLIVSVVAGLSAFAVILIVGAVAVRRKQQRSHSLAVSEEDEPPPSRQERLRTEYSDPLLTLISKSSTDRSGNGYDHTESVHEESEPFPSSEPPAYSAQEEELVLPKIKPEEPDILQETEASVEAPFLEYHFQNRDSRKSETTESFELPNSAEERPAPPDEPETEKESSRAEVPIDAEDAVPGIAAKGAEEASVNTTRRTRSSRSGKRRKNKRRRRRH